MKELQERQRAKANRHLHPTRIAVGDEVLVNLKHKDRATLQARGPLQPNYAGPFKVIAKIGENAFKVQLPASASVHNVFNTAQLKRYTSHAPTLEALEADEQIAPDDGEGDPPVLPEEEIFAPNEPDDDS